MARTKVIASMNLKSTILDILSRDDLKHIVDDREIDGVDRRSVDGMRKKLSRVRSVSAADLLCPSGKRA